MNMKQLPLAMLPLVVACATGPKPLPTNATAEERLIHTEEVLASARGLTGSFVIESKGDRASQLTGSIQIVEPNAVVITTDGMLETSPIRVELDTRSGVASRSISKGASFANHEQPVPAKLSEALAVGLSRVGLLPSISKLSSNEMIDFADGGAKERLSVKNVTDSGTDTVDGVACRRLSFTNQNGKGSMCIDDSTSLPVEVSIESGGLSSKERYSWKTASK